MGNFLKSIAERVLSSLIIGICLLAISMGIFVWLGMKAQRTQLEVADKSFLVLDLDMSLNDAPEQLDFAELVNQSLSGDQQVRRSLLAVLRAVERASSDERIEGILLRGNLYAENYGSGYAAVGELRQKLLAFKERGKPVYAYFDNAQWIDYYLASVADAVWLNPLGVLDVRGLSSNTPYFGLALQKYGVGVQAPRAGRFKSAVEPFLEKQMSEEAEQQSLELLQDLWSSMLPVVAQSRSMEAIALDGYTRRLGPLTADEAQAAGLVDETLYMDEVIERLRSMGAPEDEFHSFAQCHIDDYMRATRKAPSLVEPQGDALALVYAEGSIVDGEGQAGQVGGAALARQLRQLRHDDEVKAVVLRVNSPGGSAFASEVIQREMRLLKQEKPVVVSMGHLAASGGYWIAAYANRIFAEPTTITGSIGVFGLMVNIEELAAKHEVYFDGVKTHPFADIGTLTRPASEEELARVQGFITALYDEFLERVAEGRGLAKEAVAEIAEGRVWSGQRALSLGLVDELGGVASAIRYAREQAQLPQDSRIEEYPSQKEPAEMIAELLQGASVAWPTPDKSSLQYQLKEQWGRVYQFLGECNDPRGMYARCLWF